MKTFWRVLALLFIAAGGWFGYAAWRAHHNLVTLNVRNAPVREVVRKIEWQTWETILVHKDVDGRVTLNVRNQPLDVVLGLIAEQIESRWTAMYPLYKSGRSLEAFRKTVLGEADPAESGWTNLLARGFRFRGGPGGGGPGGGGPFGDNARSENKLVSVNIVGKDTGVAATALERYAQARVVPEDGTIGLVNLTLQDAPMPVAVKKLARQVNRRWTEYYALQPGFRPRRELAANDGPPREWTGPSPEMREQMRAQFEAQLDTMTEEERKRMLEARQRMEEMRNLTPEQRRERMQQMAADPAFQDRMQNRMMNNLKNSTPEQRAQRDQRFASRRPRPQ